MAKIRNIFVKIMTDDLIHIEMQKKCVILQKTKYADYVDHRI